MKVLILSHLLFYPADNGAKMRIFNLIRQLSHQHQIALICPEAPAPVLESLRTGLGPETEITTVRWSTSSQEHSTRAFLSPFPRSVYRVTSGADQMQRVDERIRSWDPDLVLATDPILGEFLRPYGTRARAIDIAAEYVLYIRRVLRLAPVSERPRWWLRLLKWHTYMRSLHNDVDLWIVTAVSDQASIRKQLPANAMVTVVPNGVDLEANPFTPAPDAPLQIVHTGALSYEPNLDGLLYFVREIWPFIRERIPEVRLLVTGDSTVAPAVIRTAPGIVMTGYVPEVRAVLQSSRAIVVPLRLGVGTRLKIMESMAVGTPVVSTSLGAEGLAVTDNHDILIADDPARFADQVVALLTSRDLRLRLSQSARRTVEECYTWNLIGETFRTVLMSLVQRHTRGQYNTPGVTSTAREIPGDYHF